MNYLVYCILNGYHGPARPSLMGVRDQTVWVLEGGGLCAAVSDTGVSAAGAATEIAHDVSALRLENLLRYARVVEAFNRRETVVPMRYGCGFESVAEVRTWIRQGADRFHALLARLDGCVEMGVRALPFESGGTCAGAGVSTPPASGMASGTGIAYLAARRARLALTERAERTTQIVCKALGGRFRESIAETRGLGASAMVSLYFLVERDALGGFRAAFSGIGAAAGAALMLTGPWPPYSFVCDGRAAGGVKRAG